MHTAGEGACLRSGSGAVMRHDGSDLQQSQPHGCPSVVWDVVRLMRCSSGSRPGNLTCHCFLACSYTEDRLAAFTDGVTFHVR